MLEEVKDLHRQSPRHWRYLRRRRLYSPNVSSKQIIAGQIFTVIFSIFGGLVLEEYKLHIIAFSGALILYPGLIDLCASVGGALGAKLNHHIKETPYRIRSILAADIGFAALITVAAAFLLGAIGALLGSLFVEVNYLDLISLAVLTSVMVSLVFFPLIGIIVLVLLKFKLNPDNLVGPIESSIVDVLATIFIIVAIGVIS
jgi:mgtE-like transporter